MQSQHANSSDNARRIVRRPISASLTSVVIIAILPLRAADTQPERARASDATVAVNAVAADRAATVQARYVFVGTPGSLSFELLQNACARIGPIRMESNGAVVPFVLDSTGPWLRVHDTSTVAIGRDSLQYRVTYDVELSGPEASIPLLLPATILATRRRGEAIARLSVRLPPEGRVVLPRMAAEGAGVWSARMAALPATVRIRRDAPNVNCDVQVSGASGNFKLIFWALVTTLVLWVPTYLWWANREQHAA